MADNVVLSAGTADGVTLATDDVGGVHYQIVKVSFGALDTATAVSGANPLPVVQTGTHTVTGAGGTFPVTDSGGSLTVDNGGTFAVQAAQSGTWTVQPGNTANTTAWLVTGTGGTFPVTDSGGTLSIDDGAGSITVDGTVTANLAAGTNNIGDVDVLTVPTDPFGANADAASATGSISAKLRFIASTGIPITGTVTVGAHNVTNAGTFAVQAAQSGTWTVQPGNTANTTPWLTASSPTTSGGLSVATGSITATATSVKGSAGQVYGWYFYNPNASVAYVQFFNTASGSVTLGTTAPVYSLGIPATSGANVELSNGIAHSTAITIAVTTTRAGSTSPGSSVDYNIFYK